MEAIPEATSSLVETWGGGYRLEIAVPPLPEGDLLARGRLGWRAHLVAGVAATDDDRIVEWAVTWPGMSRDDAQLMRSSSLRSKPGTPLPNGPFPRLGTASIDEARAQLESNLGVVRSKLDVFEGARIEVVVVDAARSLFGLEVEMRVARVEDVPQGALDGLRTGLVGGESSVIEGLAEVVADDEGGRVAQFMNVRVGVGFGTKAAALPFDATFPNLTGGPRTTWSGWSSPALGRR